jgi:hypothetical protein
MKLTDFQQLLYLTHIDNFESIIEKGILSHSKAQNIMHKRIDMPEVQQRRRPKRIPGGKMLHDYANLYFSARNPMLYKRKDEHKDICVLRIKKEVMNISGVVVTTGNAASEYTSFYQAETGIEQLDRKLVFAKDWTDEDEIIAAKKKTIKCAEVLVPDYVPPSLIFGAYVSCQENMEKLANRFPDLLIEVNQILFFLQ